MTALDPTFEPTPDTPAVFDEPTLLEITSAAGIPPLELIAMFVEDCESQIARMEAAVPLDDHKTIHRHAHTLKSSAANVGAMRFCALALRLETASREQLPPGFAEGLVSLRAELQHYRQATDARSDALKAA